jgi:hypothetical protein
MEQRDKGRLPRPVGAPPIVFLIDALATEAIPVLQNVVVPYLHYVESRDRHEVIRKRHPAAARNFSIDIDYRRNILRL